jgi:hypothetical protein
MIGGGEPGLVNRGEGRPTLADPCEEMLRILGLANDAAIPLRAVGGIAVRMRAPSIATAEPPRTYHDLDLVGLRRHAKQTARLFEGQGYEPNTRFNALAAGERLLFFDVANERRVDVFLDKLQMCHTLDLRDRLTAESVTLTLADLLLTKLQIVRLTDRDVMDLCGLFADNRLSTESETGGGGQIEVGRVVQVCASDWGWWRTVTGNLDHLGALWEGLPAGPGPDPSLARRRAQHLQEAIDTAPKSLRWRRRALLGERVIWYQDPEEIR